MHLEVDEMERVKLRIQVNDVSAVERIRAFCVRLGTSARLPKQGQQQSKSTADMNVPVVHAAVEEGPCAKRVTSSEDGSRRPRLLVGKWFGRVCTCCVRPAADAVLV